MGERTGKQGARRRETASLLAHDLVTRLAAQVRRPDPARLRPTVYLAVPRGADPDWKVVVARNV